MGSSRKARAAATCKHDKLYVDCSSGAKAAGFERPPLDKRLAASLHSGRKEKHGNYSTEEAAFDDGDIFPGPLVLPDDALALDPGYPSQSFKGRQQLLASQGKTISKKRNVIYVVPPPTVTDEVKALMSGWEVPVVPEELQMNGLPERLANPSTDDVCSYLRAFYYPLEVKPYPVPFQWMAWQESKVNSKRGATQNYIGLTVPPTSELVRVRYRPGPDGTAVQQLNLNDVLDAVNECLPVDGCAITMLMEHDLYEDDEDDFCCGRAYGGNRISLVSMFRYHSSLDNYAGIDLDHMWPASHCRAYVNSQCKAESGGPPPAKRPKTKAAVEGAIPLAGKASSSPLAAAVAASRSSLAPKTQEGWDGLWFSRVARTVSHELGHCFGMDHCNYFACVMQGTASVAEDVRQAPYLCPVCLQMVSWSLAPLIGDGIMINLQRLWIKEQHEALGKFCADWRHVGMFAGMEVWLAKRVETMEHIKRDEIVVSNIESLTA